MDVTSDLAVRGPVLRVEFDRCTCRLRSLDKSLVQGRDLGVGKVCLQNAESLFTKKATLSDLSPYIQSQARA
jgi:hypothetical protein